MEKSPVFKHNHEINSKNIAKIYKTELKLREMEKDIDPLDKL